MWARIHIDKYLHIIKTAQLIVENSAQRSFRYAPINFCAPQCILHPSYFLKLLNGPNKLQYYITLGWKGLPWTYSLTYLANLLVTKTKSVENTATGPYSHFIFFVTCKWAPKVRVLHYTGQGMLAIDKQSNLFGHFFSYNENYVLRIRPLGCIHNTSFSS